jgi:hypothetical protein
MNEKDSDRDTNRLRDIQLYEQTDMVKTQVHYFFSYAAHTSP